MSVRSTTSSYTYEPLSMSPTDDDTTVSSIIRVQEDSHKAGIDVGDVLTEDGQVVAPDQHDPKYETTKWEIWAYYAYYVGNNGLSLFNFAPTAYQNLLAEAVGESGMLKFAGKDRTINSIVLLSNGISFAIQIVVFLIIGSYAGSSRNPSTQPTLKMS